MKDLIGFIIFLFLVMVTRSFVVADQQQQVCQKICSLFLTTQGPVMSPINQSTQGRPGKRGPPGVKGDRGVIGPKGTVDYNLVDDMLEAKVVNATTTLRARIDEMEEKFENTLARLSNTTMKIEHKTLEHCSTFLYNGKCFQAILHKISDVKYPEAKNVCKSKGWELANIYSMEHYNLVLEYLRKESRTVVVWLGMYYNTRTKKAILSNGAGAPTLPWHTGYPKSPSDYTLTGLVSKLDKHSIDQGLHNASPGWTRMGALCEY